MRARPLSLSLLVVASVGAPALAAPTPSLAVHPAPAGDRAVLVGAPEARGHGLLRARLVAEIAREPLVLLDPAQRTTVVVAEQQWLRLMASYALHHRWLVGLCVPVVRSLAGASRAGTPLTPPPEGPGAGDASAALRVRILGEPSTGARLAAALEAWAPTGSAYASDGAAQARGELVVGGATPRADAALSAGVHARPDAELAGVAPTRVGTALTAGVAAGYRLDRSGDLRVGAEARGDLVISGGARVLDPRSTVAHVLASARLTPGGGPLEVLAAMGPGLGRGAGAADFRAFLAVGWSLEQRPPPPDDDDDGVPDATDACPELAGEPSGDRLLHGCPEAPPDRDEDSIPDAFDACPGVAGVATGERRTHGCPPPPALPPPAPRPPDPEPPPVAEAVRLEGRVLFETGNAILRQEGERVLEGVAAVLRAHPELELVEVQGHTDGRGDASLNEGLSADRARAVVAWLVVRGVDPSRMVARGYGHSRPVASDDTEEGRAKNRRVEVVVLRRTPTEGAP